MRWFKHMTDMLDDEWVQDIFMQRHGLSGYGFVCGIFEIYARACKQNPGARVDIPIKHVMRKLHISRAKLARLLEDCAAANKLSFDLGVQMLRLEIPKMAQLRDEYTKKSRPDPESLPPKKQKPAEKHDMTEAACRPQHHDPAAAAAFSSLPSSAQEDPPPLAAETDSDAVFTIRRPHFMGSEKEWLRQMIVAQCRERRLSVPEDASLSELESRHAFVAKLVRRWFLQPIEKRIAAFVYTIRDTAAQNELGYVLSAMERNYEGMRPYLERASRDVRNNDLEVILDV